MFQDENLGIYLTGIVAVFIKDRIKLDHMTR